MHSLQPELRQWRLWYFWIIFSEEEAKRNEKGIVEIKSEQAFQKLMVRFMEKLSELDAKIETFAESELKPYLER